MTTASPAPKIRNRRVNRQLELLKKMASMRAPKERKRLASAPPPPPEPRMIPSTGLFLVVVDTMSEEVACLPLLSGRDAARRIAVILRHYRPGRSRAPVAPLRTVAPDPCP